jgi:hypothetical protein
MDVVALEHRLEGSILDPELLRQLREGLAAEIFDELDELVGLDIGVVGDACSELATAAVFRVVNAICPEVLSPSENEAFQVPAYNERLSPSSVRRVVRQLGTFLVARLPERISRQEIDFLSLEMVKATLGEIAPSVLEQPIEHAQPIARALLRIKVRLSGLYPRQGAFNEHALRKLVTTQQTPFDEYTCMELAGWVLFDIMREVCPVVLLQPAADRLGREQILPHEH